MKTFALKFTLFLIGALTYLLVFNTCDLPTDPGPMPKSIIETEFEPGLNIFGVLRADSVSGSSFIHVETVMKTEEMYEGTGEIFDTTVTVQMGDSATGEVFTFTMIEDTTYRGYYFNDSFQPISGHRYSLEVQSEILPTLKAETLVPVRPEVVPNSLRISNTTLEFQISTTADTYQYNCYLFFGDECLEKQVANDGKPLLNIAFGLSDMPTKLVIIGYDQNLAEYLNSLPSFIPQTFHEMVITVENGYGCFGSLAVTTIQF